MPDSIKKQIMDRIASNLAPLKPGTFRDITREHDSTRDSKALPALMIFDGEEATVAKSATQWTCRFPVYFKIVFSSMRNAQPTKDALITEIQKKIEADLHSEFPRRHHRRWQRRTRPHRRLKPDPSHNPRLHRRIQTQNRRPNPDLMRIKFLNHNPNLNRSADSLSALECGGSTPLSLRTLP